MSDRLDRIEELLVQTAQMVAQTAADTAANQKASNERLTRIEQLVESNNRFLETFGSKVDRFESNVDRLIHRMDDLTQTMNGMIAGSNQDRQDVNTRLGSIQRKVDAIARHHGIE